MLWISFLQKKILEIKMIISEEINLLASDGSIA
jgi:hypothetical protein